jgi:hypothetical protein
VAGNAAILTERQRELRMGRVTWIVLSLAFVAWAFLAVTVVLWGLSFVETSARPVPTTLDQMSGIVLYREAGQPAEVSAQQGKQLFEGDELATSFASTASLQTFDGTVLQLFPDTRLRVLASRTGRFNPAATAATYELVAGTMRMAIPRVPDQPHTLRVNVPQGSALLFPGNYTLRAAPEATRISVWEGRTEAHMASQVEEARAGQKLILGGAESPTIREIDLLENVLANGDFSRSFEGWAPWEDREVLRPDVPGHLEIVRPEGTGAPERALRITRYSERDAHNDTGLRQQVGRDVSGAQAIRLEAMVRLDYASLSGGGYAGSEYPLMIRVRAKDRRGGDLIWTQGLYYANPEDRPTQNGYGVPQAVWLKHTVDLTSFLGQASTIDSIEVYGSGHTFDASIGEIRLLVD